MNRILVWDWPVRVLHWAFDGSLTAALVIGFGVDDEHPLFTYHMLLRIVAGFILILRIEPARRKPRAR
jgi:cytochrome b